MDEQADRCRAPTVSCYSRLLYVLSEDLGGRCACTTAQETDACPKTTMPNLVSPIMFYSTPSPPPGHGSLVYVVAPMLDRVCQPLRCYQLHTARSRRGYCAAKDRQLSG